MGNIIDFQEWRDRKAQRPTSESILPPSPLFKVALRDALDRKRYRVMAQQINIGDAILPVFSILAGATAEVRKNPEDGSLLIPLTKHLGFSPDISKVWASSFYTVDDGLFRVLQVIAQDGADFPSISLFVLSYIAEERRRLSNIHIPEADAMNQDFSWGCFAFTNLALPRQQTELLGHTEIFYLPSGSQDINTMLPFSPAQIEWETRF